jgi:hypothetical protein
MLYPHASRIILGAYIKHVEEGVDCKTFYSDRVGQCSIFGGGIKSMRRGGQLPRQRVPSGQWVG